MKDKPSNNKEKPASLGEQMASPVKYDPNNPEPTGVAKDPTEEAEKLKKKLEDFKKKVLKKFSYTMSLSVLPAAAFQIFEEDEGLLKEEVEKKPLHLMMVIPEDEFKNIQKKIKPEIIKLVQESKQNLWVHIKTPVDVWNYGLDSKFEFVDAVGGSFPLHDTGFLGALRVASIHKSLVLRKFERYVASYVIFGSLTRGTADKDSDVDVFIIIDDTDVKKMPRLQLLEKLRGMIYDYIREATALAGVKNILNVQVSLLTDFWDRVKEAEPVAFTMMRDGAPMYDRGTFLPWKLLLQMGKIKPSPEAVDKFMKYGEQTDALYKKRTLDAMVDIYWGVVTPTQALMMLAGHAPPVPKTIVSEVKDILVDKEKLMDLKELKILEKAVKYYKDYEHGKIKSIPGKDLDIFFEEAQEYDKKMKDLRKKLEARLVENDSDKIFNETFDLLKRILGNKAKDALVKDFEKELVNKGKMQKKFSQIVKDIANIKQKAKKMSQSQINEIKRNSTELIRELIDYAQRKELVAIEKGVMQVKYGHGGGTGDGKVGELVLTDSITFFVDSGKINKISSEKLTESSPQELEKALKNTKDRAKVQLDSKVLDVLKKELGNFELVI
jgi:predicted nucleotidyltransferase